MKKDKLGFPVDIVIPWVDGADLKWQRKRDSFLGETRIINRDEDLDQRYRDFGTLKYLLRSIDLFAPWVNNIYLLTDNQKPEWLNTERVQIIDHKEFIPREYLPTFNSNVIEMNIGRISKISEHFLLLNDDFLFIEETSKSDFFVDEKTIRDVMSQSILMPRDKFSHISVNNISLINQNFSKREWLSKYWKQALSFKNGFTVNLMSIFLSALPYFTRFYDPHIGIAYRKSNFITTKELFEDNYDQLMKNRFREITDISHWLVRYYQIVTGQVKARSYKFGKYFSLSDTVGIRKILEHPGKTRMIALNDTMTSSQEIMQAEKTIRFLQLFLSEKSVFEL